MALLYLQVLCSDSLSSHSSRHLLSRPNPSWVLASSGGPHLAVGLSDSMGGRLPLHAVPLHHSLEPLTDAGEVYKHTVYTSMAAVTILIYMYIC